MAEQRRMIYAKLFEKESYGNLSQCAKLLYIALIVMSDDDGRMKANAKALRGRVFPYNTEIDHLQIRSALNEIVKSKLVTFYKVDGEYYVEHPKWNDYQFLRKDRKVKSTIPSPRRQVDAKLTPTRGRSKEGSKEVIEREQKAMQYLQKIPDTDVTEFTSRFDCSERGVRSKGEDLFNYCKSHGKRYKDYKAMLLNSIKKDFPERKTPPPVQTVKSEPEEEIDRERVKGHLKNIREELGIRAKPAQDEKKEGETGKVSS